MPRKAPRIEKSARPEDPEVDEIRVPVLPRHRFALDITTDTYERAVRLLGVMVFKEERTIFDNDFSLRIGIRETRAFLAERSSEFLNLNQIAQLFYDRIRTLRNASNPESASAGQSDLLHIEDILALLHAVMNFKDATTISLLMKEEETRGLVFALASLAHHVFYDDPLTYPFAKFKSDFVEAWERSRDEAEAKRNWGGRSS